MRKQQHRPPLKKASAGTNTEWALTQNMRSSRHIFLSRFLDTGLLLYNIYSKDQLTRATAVVDNGD